MIIEDWLDALNLKLTITYLPNCKLWEAEVNDKVGHCTLHSLGKSPIHALENLCKGAAHVSMEDVVRNPPKNLTAGLRHPYYYGDDSYP